MILVTGANGFIGKALLARFNTSSQAVRALVRKADADVSYLADQVIVGDLQLACDSGNVFEAVDTVVHLAARAHIMRDSSDDPLQQYRHINTHMTLELVRSAARQGVKRFIFLSSIKVNGETSPKGRPFQPDDECIPDDPYGISKYEAEQGLFEIARETGMESVIIRSPLVYGPGVKANFGNMIKLVRKGIPLPLGDVHNLRSLVALENLVDFIACCSDIEKSPDAANQVFLISDNEDISTPELITRIARAYGIKPKLINFPVSWMSFAARLLGKQEVTRRLFGSLQVDCSKARELLDWEPVITIDEQLKKIANSQ